MCPTKYGEKKRLLWNKKSVKEEEKNVKEKSIVTYKITPKISNYIQRGFVNLSCWDKLFDGQTKVKCVHQLKKSRLPLANYQKISQNPGQRNRFPTERYKKIWFNKETNQTLEKKRMEKVKKRSITNIRKLDDANFAGKKKRLLSYSNRGRDSARGGTMSGISKQGQECFGWLSSQG